MRTAKIFMAAAALAAAATTAEAQKAAAPEKRQRVEIRTDLGTMVVELYNETPKHRDNFLKLVREGYYEGLIFHRVINNFMIQGGDPESRGAAAGRQLGSGGPGYTVEAEIDPRFVHKKGALAAARQGDNVNPQKRSSGSQFYIVDGQPASAGQLQMAQSRAAMSLQQQLAGKYFAAHPDDQRRLRDLQAANQQDSAQALAERITRAIEQMPEYKPLTYTPEQVKTYGEHGGTPHLDGAYTVFGEVVQGLEVIDLIAAQPTLPGDRPKIDIKMHMRVLK